MKKVKFISLIILFTMLLTSCRSVYIAPEESSEGLSEIIDGEYFTDGSLYKCGNENIGVFYKGSFVFVEKQRTLGPRGKLDKDGKEYIRYDEIEMKRIVKFNPATGITSSVCLDPVCNHSFESGCLMLVKPNPGGRSADIVIDKIIGDWLIYYFRENDDKFISRITTVCYNLKTGESRSMCEEALGSSVMTRWICGSVFEDKYYCIKQQLDYSETDYAKNESGKTVLDYAPKTVQILCEYDVETGVMKDLFEIPENYLLTAVSSERFFFRDDTETIYCCNRDGSNMRQEKYFDFTAENMVGTYAYSFDGLDGFTYFDLKTNEKKTVTVEYDEYKHCVLGDNGVLFDHVSSWNEYQALLADQKNKYREYIKSMSVDETWELIEKEQRTTLYNATSRVFMSDFTGENMRLIYEEDKAVIQTVYAWGDYLFAIRKVLKNDDTVEGGECIINIKTGEITVPPLLEIITPDWYVNN